MLRAVVFDLDGIIIDSESLHLAAYQDVLTERGIAMSAIEYAERHLGFDDPTIFQRVSSDRGLGWTSADVRSLVDEKIARYRSLLSSGPRLFPGASDCIARFAGEVPLAIASGALRQEIEYVLDRSGLRNHFRVLVGSDDTPRSKPAPDPYALAVEMLGNETASRMAPCDVVGIEDSIHGIESATAAGLRTVAVTNTYSTRELAGADLIIKSLEALHLDRLRALCE